MVPHQFWFGRLYHKMFPSSALKSPTCYVPPRHLTLITLAPWTSPLSLTTSLGILPLHPTPWFPWSTLSKAPVTSNWPPTAKTKNTVQGLTLILQDFILLTCLLLEILSSFGFPSALQPQQSPLTLVFLFRHFMSIFPNALNVLTCCSFSGNCPAGLSAPSAGFPWMISYSHVAPTLTYDVRPHESPAQTFLHLLYNCLEGRSTCMSYCCLKFSKTELLPLSPPLDLNVAVYQETVLSS